MERGRGGGGEGRRGLVWKSYDSLRGSRETYRR